MGRRRHRGWVHRTPENFYFSKTSPDENKYLILTVVEFEAMRLKHYENLTQQEAASLIGVSQPTFSRILEEAHQKVTRALIEGKDFQVYGGDFEYKHKFNGYGCLDCNHEWEDKMASTEKKVKCVKCQSTNIYYLMRESF